MWWLLALLTFASACDDFRPLSEIDPISCSGSPTLKVYGSVDLEKDTIEFPNPMLVAPAPTAERVELRDGSAHLLVLAVGTTRVGLADRELTGTNGVIRIDCENPSAGRFEAWFVTGELSGYWRADSGL